MRQPDGETDATSDISAFTDDYDFLSNFFYATVIWTAPPIRPSSMRSRQPRPPTRRSERASVVARHLVRRRAWAGGSR